MEIDKDKLNDLVSPFQRKTGGLISALRAIQGTYRCIPKQADEVLADIFNVSRAEVRGVISFYADFTREEKGKVVVKVCAAEACQAVGGRKLATELSDVLGLKMGETTLLKEVTLEAVYCLGLCSCAPAVMVGDKLVGRADAKKVENTLKQTTGKFGHERA